MGIFSHVELLEIIEEYATVNGDIFSHVELLEIIEEYATVNGGIDSERELSARFDEDIAPLVIEQHGEDDEPAMTQAFNDWSDSMCIDGELHELQYNQYCYVGKYS